MLSCAIVTLNTSPGCLGIMKYVAFGLVEYQCNNETIYLLNHWQASDGNCVAVRGFNTIELSLKLMQCHCKIQQFKQFK